MALISLFLSKVYKGKTISFSSMLSLYTSSALVSLEDFNNSRISCVMLLSLVVNPGMLAVILFQLVQEEKIRKNKLELL